MKSIRGAIAVVENNEESILSSSKKLINEILINNAITENDIEFVIFTVTSDITEAFPAKAFRELGMTSIAAIDTLAPNINSDLSGCIRILIYLNKDLEEINQLETELLKIRQRASEELVKEQLAADESFIIYQNMLNGCQQLLAQKKQEKQQE